MPVSFITLIIGTIWHNSSDLLIYVKRNPLAHSPGVQTKKGLQVEMLFFPFPAPFFCARSFFAPKDFLYTLGRVIFQRECYIIIFLLPPPFVAITFFCHFLTSNIQYLRINLHRAFSKLFPLFTYLLLLRIWRADWEGSGMQMTKDHELHTRSRTCNSGAGSEDWTLS